MTLAFDGRYDTCYPTEVVDMHFDFLLGEANGKRWRGPDSGPIDGRRVLKYGEPELVLIDRLYEHPRSIMRAEERRRIPIGCSSTATALQKSGAVAIASMTPRALTTCLSVRGCKTPAPAKAKFPARVPIRSESNQLASENPQAVQSDVQL